MPLLQLHLRHNPNNYPNGVMFVLDGPIWIHSNGALFAHADGSAKWRRLGAQIAPAHTDWRVDPYTGYDANGYPSLRLVGRLQPVAVPT
jgi:hypothetical protein